MCKEFNVRKRFRPLKHLSEPQFPHLQWNTQTKIAAEDPCDKPQKALGTANVHRHLRRISRNIRCLSQTTSHQSLLE